MNAHIAIYTSGDNYTLLYRGYPTQIQTTDEVAIARGIASILVKLWSDEGQNVTRLMQMYTPQLLDEMGLHPNNPHIMNAMMEVAQTHQEKNQ